MPQRRIAVARDREDLAGFAQEVERLQYQDEREEDREAARQEQLHHVECEAPRREEGEVYHASTARSLRLGRIERARLATLAKKRSRAPIGCPPGRWASTWYIHRIIAANRSSGTPRERIGFNFPFAPICSP